MIKRVLLGVGGTPFTKVAIRRAAELCQLHDATLTAVTVVDQTRLRNVGAVPIGAGAAANALREQRVEEAFVKVDESIDELKSLCSDLGVKTTIYHEQGDPFQLMVDYSRYHDVNIFGLRSMFEYDILGSGANPGKVLDHMLTGGVRPIIAVSEQFRAIKRVLIAYGGSIRAAATMRRFLQMNLWPDMQLRLLSCTTNESEADKHLDDALIYCRDYGYEPETCHRPGHNSSKEILAEAESWDADMIVLGTSQKSVMTRSIFGTTTLSVIQHADRPLFIGE